MLRWTTVLLGIMICLPALAKEKDADCSGDFGTSVRFEDTPADAARLAKPEGKLVLVLHVSGHFEEPRFT